LLTILLFRYIAQISPGPYGTRKSYLFLFQRDFWFPQKAPPTHEYASLATGEPSAASLLIDSDEGESDLNTNLDSEPELNHIEDSDHAGGTPKELTRPQQLNRARGLHLHKMY